LSRICTAARSNAASRGSKASPAVFCSRMRRAAIKRDEPPDCALAVGICAQHLRHVPDGRRLGFGLAPLGGDLSAFCLESHESSAFALALLYERRSGFLLALDCRQGGASLAPLGSNLDRGVHARLGRAMGGPRRIQAASPAAGQGTLKARMYSSAPAALSS